MIIAICTALPLLAAGVFIGWTACRAHRETLPRNFLDRNPHGGHTAFGGRTARRPRRRSGSALGRGDRPHRRRRRGGVVGEEHAVSAAVAGCAWVVVWLIIGSVAAGKAASRVSQS
jgi:hypothetical protein